MDDVLFFESADVRLRSLPQISHGKWNAIKKECRARARLHHPCCNMHWGDIHYEDE